MNVSSSAPAAWGPVALAMVGDAIRFTYRNYQGEVSERIVERPSIWFGATKWHPEPQWLMCATDLQKGALRDFAMCDMSNVRSERRG